MEIKKTKKEVTDQYTDTVVESNVRGCQSVAKACS
jgi:hypothetical protein